MASWKRWIPTRLLDEAGLATLTIDPLDKRITFANAPLTRMLGLAPGALIGRSYLQLLHPDFEAQEAKRLQTGTPCSVELALRHENRDSVWFRASLILEPDRALVLLQDLTQAQLVDVTERRSLEAQLRQAQKMEALGALASSISHDFNNTLMGIIGCAQLAQKNLENDHAQAERFIEDIKRTALSSAKIIRQLLTFGRSQPALPEHVEVDPVIAATEPLLQRLVNERVRLSFELSAPGGHVRVEPGQVEQILINLIVNAGHAMPNGGTLAVATHLEKDMLQMSVSDEGIGIPEEIKGKIFEPFFTTKPEGHGSGLGLSTVYGIIKQADGTIDVDSELYRGTTFTVRLPLVPPDNPTEHEGVLEASTPIFSGVALLVEDDPLVRLTVEHELEQLGFQVLAAADGTEALSLARQCTSPPALLVTDMGLGSGMSGAQLAVELITLHPGIRPIYMSAHPRSVLTKKGLPNDAPALQKPFSGAQLSRMIQRVLGGPAPEPTPPVPENGPDRPTCVLLVEDYEIARLACRELLEDLGYLVLEASTAKEALAHCDGEVQIDVLLTDLGLPDQTGDVLAKTLEARFPAMGTIFMSGSSIDHEGIDPSAIFIEKPVELDELASKVRELGTARFRNPL